MDQNKPIQIATLNGFQLMVLWNVVGILFSLVLLTLPFLPIPPTPIPWYMPALLLGGGSIVLLGAYPVFIFFWDFWHK